MNLKILALALATLIGISAKTIAQTLNRAAPLEFQGRYLVSISDADMLASAYVDGKLGPREGRDAISVIPLAGKHIRDLRAYEAEASNSVAGPPGAVAVTPDGRYALVVETLEQRPEGDWQKQTFADLKHGKRLLLFDLSNPTRPTQVQEVAIAERPTSVSINGDGSLVSVTFHPKGAGVKTPLALIPLTKGRLGQPIYPPVSSLPPGQELIHTTWHPTQNTLALVNTNAAEISFAKVVTKDGNLGLESNGTKKSGNAYQLSSL